jgi:hypothetical protein
MVGDDLAEIARLSPRPFRDDQEAVITRASARLALELTALPLLGLTLAPHQCPSVKSSSSGSPP